MTDASVNLANMEVTARHGALSGAGRSSNSIQKSLDKQGFGRSFSKSVKQQKQSTEQSPTVSTAAVRHRSQQLGRNVHKTGQGDKVSATGKFLPPAGNGKPLHTPATLGEKFEAFEMAMGQVIPSETALNSQPFHTFEGNKFPVNTTELNSVQSSSGGMESKIAIPGDTITGHTQTGKDHNSNQTLALFSDRDPGNQSGKIGQLPAGSKADSVAQPNVENGTRAGEGLGLVGAQLKAVSETRKVPPRMTLASQSVAGKVLASTHPLFAGERLKPVATKLNTGSAAAFGQLLGELETEQSTPKDMDSFGLRLAASRSNSQPGVTTPNTLQLFTNPTHPAWSQELGQKVTWLVQQDLQQAKLQINPKHLGPLDVKITVGQDQQVSVSFTTNSATVKEAIDQAMPRLREMLEQQGLDLADVNVSDQSNKHARDKNTESRQTSVTDQELGGEESTHEQLSAQGLAVSQPLDGRIDLFV